MHFHARFSPYFPPYVRQSMQTSDSGLEVTTVTTREFKAKTKELLKEIGKRKDFTRTALAGKRMGDCVSR